MMPPFINDLCEEEILAKQYGPKRKRASIFINNTTGEITKESKFGPVTQPVQRGEKFVMPVRREARSPFSMVQDPEERAALKREAYQDRIASMSNQEDRNFERWKDDNRISEYHEVETIGHENIIDGEQNFQALQDKIAREEARQQHQRYLDSLYRRHSSTNRLGGRGGGG
jgi:hypothetical protein